MWAVDTSIRTAWESRGRDGDDLYGCLGVPDGAPKTLLKKSYVAGLRELHPDKGGTSEDGGQLTYAYKLLQDDVRRRLYDKHLKVAHTPTNVSSQRKRLEAGFLAARTAIQDYEREATRARHELDEQEMRLSKIKYMRITAEAEAARKRTAQEEERILARERDKHK